MSALLELVMDAVALAGGKVFAPHPVMRVTLFAAIIAAFFSIYAIWWRA